MEEEEMGEEENGEEETYFGYKEKAFFLFFLRNHLDFLANLGMTCGCRKSLLFVFNGCPYNLVSCPDI
jgi:hypothetical protein